MSEERVDELVRRAIAGDRAAVAWFESDTGAGANVLVQVMAALLTSRVDRLNRALTVATSRRDRQFIAIARASLSGDRGLVDALARDHLVDFPDSYVVAWIASGARGRDQNSNNWSCPALDEE